MTKRIFRVLLAGIGLACAQTSLAVDGASIEAGVGEGTDMARINLRWDWDKPWLDRQNWTGTAFWEAGLGEWHGTREGGKELGEIGLTPVFRLNSKLSHFYWEGGIGVHLMTQDHIDDKRIFGSHFSFGDMLGFGWQVGNHGQYEIGYRFQHLSNANTAEPNDSINFHQVRLGLNF